MIKHFITLLLLTTALLSAQEETKPIKVTENLLKVNILYPGIAYEHALGKKTTLYSSLNFIPAYPIENKQLKYWTVAPNIQEEFRYYYNLEKRAKKDKNTIKNTGFYFSLIAKYGLPPLGRYNSYTKIDGLTVAPTCGMQYTHKSGFNMGIGLGFGYNFSSQPTVNGTTLVNYFTIGWVLK